MVTAQKVPTARGLPILSGLIDWARDPIDLLAGLRRYGDMVEFIGPPARTVFVNRPDYVEDVVVTRAWNFVAGRTPSFKAALRDAVPAAEGTLHIHQRGMMTPLLEPENIAGLGDAVVDHAIMLRDRWQRDTVVDVEPEMARVTIPFFVEMLVGPQARSATGEVEAALDATEYLATRSTHPLAPLLDLIPTLEANRRYRAAMKRLDETIYRRIHAARRAGGTAPGMLGTMLAMRDEAGRGMTNRQLRDEMTAFYVANMNTGKALTWLWYLLSEHPDVASRIHAEIDTVIGDRRPTVADLPRLTQIERLVKESLRLYPPTWVFPRTTLQDIVVGPYLLPRGSHVILSPYLMHRDPRYWSDPERVDLERWTPEAVASRPRFAYFPFSGGPRSCMGEHLAPMVMALVVATIGQRWHPRLVPGFPVERDTRFALRPKYGMRMQITSRRVAPAPPARREAAPASV